MKCVACSVVMVVLANVAQAQAIYRCGPNGTQYSQTPCAGGKVLESSDPRSAAQRAEAVRVAAQERRNAAAMERERRAEEARTKPALAGGLNARPVPAEAAASATKRGKAKKNGKKQADRAPDFVAVEPVTGKKSAPR